MKQLKKWISVLLVLGLLLPVAPVHAHGTEASDDETVFHYVEAPVISNPTYSNAGSIGQTVIAPEPIEGVETNISSDDYLTDLSEATDLLREAMKARSSTVTIYVKQPASGQPKEKYNELYETFVNGAFSHTGVPTEGDYIYLQFAMIRAPGSYATANGYDYFVMNYELQYYTSAEQEAQMDEAVPELLSELNLAGKSDYEKVKAVYDWLCLNVKYDYTNLNNPSYTLKYSGYAALVNRTAVCQGYAVLFYRLMLELGIDCRAIGGTGNGGDHSWNIVELGDKYYNLDATWDAEYYPVFGTYNYFLRANSTFGDHQREIKYNNAQFNASYPMGTSDYDPKSDIVPVTGVSLNSANITVTEGETAQLTAIVKPDNATNSSVTFTSSDPEIAAVNAYTGEITALKNGTATITVTTSDGGFTAQCVVTVLCNHDFSEEIADDAHLVPDTGLSCINPKQYYYDCTKCDAISTNAWSSEEYGPHTYGDDWKFNEEGHQGICTICSQPGELESHIPDREAPTQNKGVFCAVCDFLLEAPLDPSAVVAEGLWDFGPVKWKITADGTLTIIGKTHIQGKTEYIWKDYSHFINRIVIEDGILTIPNEAFSNMENVESVYIGNTVTKISDKAFAHCEKLKEVHIPASVTLIKKHAFYDCAALEKLTFAENAKLEEIEDYAFFANGLKELTTPASLRSLGSYVFSQCPDLKTIHLTEGLEQISAYCFAGCPNLKNVSVPSTAVNLYGHVFDECPALEHYEFYSEQLSWDLRDHTNLKSAVIAGDATNIPTFMFRGCTALEDVTLGDRVTHIGDFAFESCTALPGLNIPDSVETIGGDAFAYTTSLKKITIPASVVSISSFAFRGSGIQEITFLGDAPDISTSCFFNITATAYYPADNETWTAGKLQGYGGNITWVPMGGAHEHTYFDTVVAPKCTEDGYTIHTCACGDTYQDTIVPATGHSMLIWYVHTEPTCQSEGEERSNCENCSYYEYHVIPKVDHEYEIYTLNPTCSSDGYIREQCKYCLEVISETPLPATGNHIYTDESDLTCDFCGAIREIDDTEFFFMETEWAALILTNQIRAENGMDPVTVFPALQQVARIRAEELNQYYDFQRPDGSSINDLMNAYSITKCKTIQTYSRFSTTNYVDNWVDSFYDFVLNEGYTHIGAGNNDNKWFNVMIDCGYGINCANYTDMEILIPEGLEITPEMSVLEMGLVAVLTCDVHGTCYLPVIDAYCPDYDYYASSFTITLFGMSETLYFEGEECPHDWIYEDCKVEEACSLCGEIRPAIEHSFDAWSVVYNPTCTDTGEEERFCKICSVREIRDIPMLEHTYSTEIVLPTCTEEGYTIYTCDVCGDSFADKIVPATGHTGGEATCCSPAICTVCGASYGEKNPANHAGGTEIRDRVEAEEFKDGYSGDTYCKGCGKLLEKGSVIFATHTHSYAAEWSADANNHWHVCSCGEKADLASHVPGAEPTETSPQVCTVCGWELKPALVHTHKPQKVEAKEATHTEDGNKEYYICSCGNWYEDAEGKKLIEDHDSVIIAKFALGDVDHDHRLTSMDAMLVMQYKAGLLPATIHFCEECANVDGFMGINSMDAMLILQYRAGLIESFR